LGGLLRPRIKAKAIKADFHAALALAVDLSKTGEADYLPGWCGPHGYVQPPAPTDEATPAKTKPKKAARPT
jgi:hypothetical protein